jgi:hypothetical protein
MNPLETNQAAINSLIKEQISRSPGLAFEQVYQIVQARNPALFQPLQAEDERREQEYQVQKENEKAIYERHLQDPKGDFR